MSGTTARSPERLVSLVVGFRCVTPVTLVGEATVQARAISSEAAGARPHSTPAGCKAVA